MSYSKGKGPDSNSYMLSILSDCTVCRTQGKMEIWSLLLTNEDFQYNDSRAVNQAQGLLSMGPVQLPQSEPLESGTDYFISLLWHSQKVHFQGKKKDQLLSGTRVKGRNSLQRT